jgi:hypothetical protein
MNVLSAERLFGKNNFMIAADLLQDVALPVLRLKKHNLHRSACPVYRVHFSPSSMNKLFPDASPHRGNVSI